MRTDRLLRLADFLEKEVTQEKFNMYRWTNTCGTVHCAFGWATQIPEFRDAGLKMSGQDDYGHATGSYSEWRYPMYENRECYDAAVTFFEIDLILANWIFSPDNYNAPVAIKDVVERIQRTVVDYGVCGETSCSTP